MLENKFISSLFTIVFGLILVCTITVTNANAQLQPSLPNMSNYQVSGEYSDPNSNLDITFPDGWSGFKIPQDNGTIIVLQKNDNLLKSGILLAIFDKSKITKIPVGQPTSLAFKNMKCDITSTTAITLNEMNGIQVMQQCSGEKSYKYKMIFFQTTKSLFDLMLGAQTTEFEKDVGDFNNTLSTLKISNTIEAPSIPEFGSLSGLVIMISVIGLVVISRFKLSQV